MISLIQKCSLKIVFYKSLLIAICSLFSPYSFADIFVYSDDIGVVTLSNIPDNNDFKVILTEPVADTLDGMSAQPMTHTTRMSELISNAAKDNQIEEALLHAVIATESAYNPKAISPKGAIGLMQLMPQTAKYYGIKDATNPQQNICGGAHYLKDLMSKYNDDKRLVLAAYNAGESAVAKYGNKIPPYSETVAYVDKVMRLYHNNLKKAVIN